MYYISKLGLTPRNGLRPSIKQIHAERDRIVLPCASQRLQGSRSDTRSHLSSTSVPNPAPPLVGRPQGDDNLTTWSFANCDTGRACRWLSLRIELKAIGTVMHPFQTLKHLTYYCMLTQDSDGCRICIFQQWMSSLQGSFQPSTSFVSIESSQSKFNGSTPHVSWHCADPARLSLSSESVPLSTSVILAVASVSLTTRRADTGDTFDNSTIRQHIKQHHDGWKGNAHGRLQLRPCQGWRYHQAWSHHLSRPGRWISNR